MRIEWLDSAIYDLQRLRNFILPHDKDAAQRVFQLIKRAVTPLLTHPHIGKPAEDLSDFHDLVIPFGASGYVIRYRIEADTVFIVAIKHCREAGFSDQTPILSVVKESEETVYGMPDNAAANNL